MSEIEERGSLDEVSAITPTKINDDERLKLWLPNCIVAAICFCLCNSFISYITERVNGVAAIFYMSFGAIIVFLVFQTAMAIKRYRNPHEPDYITKCEPRKPTLWHPHNLVINGYVRWINVVRFGIFGLITVFVNCNIFLTMYYSHLADINVGVITTIWAIQPLFGSLLDYWLYKEELKCS